MMHTHTLMAILALPATFLMLACAQSYEGETEDEVRVQQRTMGFAEWDEDDDGILDADEFDSWWNDRGFVGEWDADADDEVSEEEFADVLVIRWDTDGDSSLSESEWREGIRWFGDDADPGAWRDWDQDGDSELDANEVHEGLESEGLYDTVDMDDDAVFDDEELGDFFFDAIDVNDDDEIDTTEWDDFEL